MTEDGHIHRFEDVVRQIARDLSGERLRGNREGLVCFSLFLDLPQGVEEVLEREGGVGGDSGIVLQGADGALDERLEDLRVVEDSEFLLRKAGKEDGGGVAFRERSEGIVRFGEGGEGG